MIDPPYSGTDEDEESGKDEESTGSNELNKDDIASAFPPEPATSSNKGKSKSLYAPPTLQELDQLNPQTSTSTFNLQLEALLSSTVIPQNSTSNTSLKILLKSLHTHILSLPAIPTAPPRKAIAKLHKGGGVFQSGIPKEFSLKGDEKWGLGWEVPEEIFVGGSWSVVGGYKKGKGEMGDVELVVVMPKVSKPHNGLV